jgi:hypothetical protein
VIDGERGELWEIRGKAPNTRSVRIKPLGPAVLLTALTAICKIASLELIPESFIKNVKSFSQGLMIAFNFSYALMSFDGNLLKIDRKRASFAAEFLGCEICARIICDDVRGALINIDPKLP